MYLGEVVGGEQVKPIHLRTEAIVMFSELQHSLGMVGYYRGFYKNEFFLFVLILLFNDITASNPEVYIVVCSGIILNAPHFKQFWATVCVSENNFSASHLTNFSDLINLSNWFQRPSTGCLFT